MNLLEQTRRLLQGLAPPSSAKVQYYRVACAEGHRLSGERTEGYQALRCPTCGEGIFVLPRSPLPDLPPLETSRGPRQPVADLVERHDEMVTPLSDPSFGEATTALPGDIDGEIEWLEPGEGQPEGASTAAGIDTDATEHPYDLVAPDIPTSPADPGSGKPRRPRPAEAPQQGRSGARARSQGTKPSPSTSRPKRPATAAEPPAPIEVSRRERLATWALRRRNPLIFAAVALVVIATVIYRSRQSKFQDLPRIAELGRVDGLKALDEGKFDTAHQLLSEAKRAVESLGDAVEGASEIRHGADEAALFTSLVPDSLETILAEASADPEEWASRFATLYRGRSIIVKAQVTAVPDASGSGPYELDYRILPLGEGYRENLRVGKLDLAGFQLFEYSKPKVGDEVRFGARLASFTLDRKTNGWLVGLVPESGVYLLHPKALEALNWSSAEEMATEDPQ